MSVPRTLDEALVLFAAVGGPDWQDALLYGLLVVVGVAVALCVLSLFTDKRMRP